MTQRVKATVRYDGTDFAGWQIQPGARTVQGAIEQALRTVAGRPVRIMSAGRTDAGVHALGQVFSFDWSASVPLDRLRRSLSQMLGPEIRIESVQPVPDDFHATRDADWKRYAYVLAQAREADPFTARYAWTLDYDLDRAHVRGLAQQFVGPHDFAGFCSSPSSVETTERTILAAEVHDGPVVGPLDAQAAWRIEFTGDGFLYKMVRNLVGTLIDVARGRLPESTIPERLNAPYPYHGYTAPAKGLFLLQVHYPDSG